MHTKKRLIPIALMVIIFFSLCIDYTYSSLSPMKRRELMIAYMNGYYEAAQLDINEMKLLQGDKDSLKEKVIAEGDKYATLIDVMNPSKSGDNKGYRKNKEREIPEGSQKY